MKKMHEFEGGEISNLHFGQRVRLLFTSGVGKRKKAAGSLIYPLGDAICRLK